MTRALADEHFTKVKWAKNYINQLRQINYRKLDEATSYVIKVISYVYDLFERMLIYSIRRK